MKKTLKTLINTGLFMLCFSHSHGLALVYNLNDVNKPVNSSVGVGTILSNFTDPGFNGIDDTFAGEITFNFTFTYDVLPSNNAYITFGLKSNAGGIHPIVIGNYFSDYWNGYRIESSDGGINGFLNPLTFGNNPVVEGQSQAFTLTIDYNAGALDTGTLIIDGDSTVYVIDDYDYSFDEIRFTAAIDSAISATNMSVSIVPEPATYALLSGALALVFVAVRRRFKA